MLHRIRALNSLMFLVFVLSFLLPLTAQSNSGKPSVKHYGYSGQDRVLECLHRLYGKPAASFPGIRVREAGHPTCPDAREYVSAWLANEVSPLLVAPNGIQSSLKVLDGPEWVYLIPASYLAEGPGRSPDPGEERWKNITIKTRIETDETISAKEAELLAPAILATARAIPVRPQAGAVPASGAAELEVRLHFYKTKLGPNEAESVITIVDQPSLLVVGRLVYGEILDGKYQMLWDSPLLNSRGRLDFYDANGDGRNEIVWRSATCGAQNCSPQQLVVFDRDGHEITRQKECPDAAGSYYYFGENDGVCAIEGNEIQFTVISPYPDSTETVAPKDIMVSGTSSDDKETILTITNGAYVRTKLSAPELADTRKRDAVNKAAALNEQALALMKAGKYSTAAERFVDSSQLVNGENADYTNSAGLAYYNAQDYKNAIGWLSAAISVDPKRAVSYFIRAESFTGLASLAKGRSDRKILLEGYCADTADPCLSEARKDYQKALELAPKADFADDAKKKLSALKAP
jgi:hypothetical protein